MSKVDRVIEKSKVNIDELKRNGWLSMAGIMEEHINLIKAQDHQLKELTVEVNWYRQGEKATEKRAVGRVMSQNKDLKAENAHLKGVLDSVLEKTSHLGEWNEIKQIIEEVKSG